LPACCVLSCALQGSGWEPQRTLVLAVADAGGIESPDFQGLLSGLLSTCMQAGFHFTAAAGIDLLNLWPAVAGVNPLQFRMSAEQVGETGGRAIRYLQRLSYGGGLVWWLAGTQSR
jgi:hypothetical protein